MKPLKYSLDFLSGGGGEFVIGDEIPESSLDLLAEVAKADERSGDEGYAWEVHGPKSRGGIKKRVLLTELGTTEDSVRHMRNVALSHHWSVSPKSTLIDPAQLSKDLCFLIMGLESHTFPFDHGSFRVSSTDNFTVENISPEVFHSFTKDFIRCGNLTRQMQEVVGRENAKKNHGSSIYQAFVQAVNSFLKLHRATVNSLVGNAKEIFHFIQSARPFVGQVEFIANICGLPKVHRDGGFDVPPGLDLVNHILIKTQHVGQKNLSLLAASLLRQCTLPYFKFLDRWLFEGKCLAGDNEFGVRADQHYLSVKDASYWTRGYTNEASSLNDAGVNFYSLTQRILNCGKALNLLRHCDANHPLCVVGSRLCPKTQLLVCPTQEAEIKSLFNNHLDSVKAKVAIYEKFKRDEAEEQKRADEIEQAKKVKELRERMEEMEKIVSVKPTSIVVIPSEGSRKDVALKVGQEREEVVLKADSEEKRRIEAVKRDLEQFYEGKASVSPPRDISKPSTPIQNAPKTPEKSLSPEPQRDSKSMSPDDPDSTPRTRVRRREKKTPTPTDGRRGSRANILSDENVFKIPIEPEKAIVRPLRKYKSVEELITVKDPGILSYDIFSSLSTERSTVRSVPTNEGPGEIPNAFAPMELMLQRSIEIPLRSQLSIVNAAVLKYLFEEDSLRSHLQAIRNYLLLMDSEFSHNLCSGILEKYNKAAPNPSVLSRVLREAISTSSRASQDKLAMHLGFTAPPPSQAPPENHLGFNLAFQVQWPLTIILSADNMSNYQQMFHLLLNLETGYLMIQQTFLILRRHKRVAADKRYKEIQLIRHRMLNYVMTIRGYVRDQILEKCWKQFNQDVDRYVSCVDTLKTVHSFYVDKLMSKLFQKKEAKPLIGTIYKTLEAIQGFCHGIQSRMDLIEDDEADDQVNDGVYDQAKRSSHTFQACLNCFISVVSKLVQRGYKHHVRELLVCLKNASDPTRVNQLM